jgi:hypothetical protein
VKDAIGITNIEAKKRGREINAVACVDTMAVKNDIYHFTSLLKETYT